MAFRDYEKASDSVDTVAALEALKGEGTEKIYIILSDEIYRECTGRIILHKKSKTFQIREGASQGDSISPKLFTECLEGIFRRLDREKVGFRINGLYLRHLRLADVIVLFSQCGEGLGNVLQELQRAWS